MTIAIARLQLKDLSFEELCRDKVVVGAVLRELLNHGKRVGLEKWEMPGAVTLCQVLTKLILFIII